MMLLQSSDLLSQGHAQNLQKYWNYRERLRSEFMITGDGAGMAMPAERRDTTAKFLKWSDNTIWLGWYIGMLALEYHMLNDAQFPGFDNGDTAAAGNALNELYYALRAVKRLDEIAETVFPAPCDTTALPRNGFFIRDDVPQNFHTHFPGMNFIESDFTEPDV